MAFLNICPKWVLFTKISGKKLGILIMNGASIVATNIRLHDNLEYASLHFKTICGWTNLGHFQECT
jgi:hypothetical protein